MGGAFSRSTGFRHTKAEEECLVKLVAVDGHRDSTAKLGIADPLGDLNCGRLSVAALGAAPLASFPGEVNRR
jgi:hypothetical protein